MDNPTSLTPPSARMHPLAAAAAVSLIALSAAGIGALTGVLPRAGSADPAPGVADRAATQEAAPAPAARVPAPTPRVVPAAPAPQAEPVRRAVIRTSAPARAPEPVREVVEVREYERPASPTPVEQRPATTERVETAQRTVDAPQPVAAAGHTGTVESVREITDPAEPTGLGAVAGGVAGAVIGKQFGNGSGRTIMSVLGAAGGAYAGHQIEKNVRGTKRWEIGVRLDDGSLRTLPSTAEPLWRAGDRVRIVNGSLRAA